MITETPHTEPPPEGQQGLVPGFAPVTLHERLMVRMAAPIAPKRNSRCRAETLRHRPGNLSSGRSETGPGNEAAHDQCDLIDFLRAKNSGASTPPLNRRTDPCNSPISHSTN